MTLAEMINQIAEGSGTAVEPSTVRLPELVEKLIPVLTGSNWSVKNDGSAAGLTVTS